MQRQRSLITPSIVSSVLGCYPYQHHFLFLFHSFISDSPLHLRSRFFSSSCQSRHFILHVIIIINWILITFSLSVIHSNKCETLPCSIIDTNTIRQFTEIWNRWDFFIQRLVEFEMKLRTPAPFSLLYYLCLLIVSSISFCCDPLFSSVIQNPNLLSITPPLDCVGEAERWVWPWNLQFSSKLNPVPLKMNVLRLLNLLICERCSSPFL